MNPSKFVLLLPTLFFFACGQGDKSSSNNMNLTSDEPVSRPADLNPSEEEHVLYIGTYTREEGHVNGKARGIHQIVMNAGSGEMKRVTEYDAGINPSYVIVHPTKKFLYAANEGGGKPDEEFGSISAYAIGEDGGLTLINSVQSMGVAPCHIAFDQYATYVLAANYVSGTVTSYPLAGNGRLGGPQNVLEYKGVGTHPRQEAPHAHYVQAISNGKVISTDLGTDHIRIHQLLGGQLQPEEESIVVAAGSGPRHIALHPEKGFWYVLNELSATIDVISYSDSSNQIIQTISTLGRGEKDGGSAAIKITPDGRYLYASNRGTHNNIAMYRVGYDGMLELIGHQSSLGNVPRDFEISPDGKFLVVANQNSDNLISFAIDYGTGRLQKASTLKDVATPACVRFM